MLESLKKLDKKFLITFGVIIFFPIFVILVVAVLRGCSDGKISYEKYEDKMKVAAEKYVKKNNKEMEEAETIKINLSELVENGYIKSTDKLLKDDSCKGTVTVRKTGSLVDDNKEGFLNYIPNLKCNDYSTVRLVDKVKENIATSESGLYLVGDNYIYKGDKVKNYISFYDQLYRIVSIDSDNIIKLVKVKSSSSVLWDDKFNTEADRYYGKNIYKDSSILDYLISDYKNAKNYSDEAKIHIVPYNACIGSRNSADYSINRNIDCSSVLENQVISLMNVSDYALASLDSECLYTNSDSCNNYNYLYSFLKSTWTSNVLSDNSYSAFCILNGISYYKNTNKYNSYHHVIYIDGNELYKEGLGTDKDPFIIK